MLAGVRELEPHLRGAGLRVDGGVDVGEACGPLFRRIVRQGDAGLLPDLDERQLVLVDVRVHPDRGEIGDLVERHSRLGPVALEGHLLDHDARDRRVDRLIELGLPALLERPDLLLGEIPETEALAARAEQRPCAVERTRDVAAAETAERLVGEQVLPLRRDQLGAVDREQRIALADWLARVVDEEVADVPLHLQRHLGELALVVVETAHGPDHLLQGTALDRAVREPDRLLLTAVEADRSAGEALLGPDAFRRWRRVLRGWLSGRLRIVVCNQRRGSAGRAEQSDTDHEERNEASCHFGMPHCLMSRGTSLPTARSRSAYACSKSASAW